MMRTTLIAAAALTLMATAASADGYNETIAKRVDRAKTDSAYAAWILETADSHNLALVAAAAKNDPAIIAAWIKRQEIQSLSEPDDPEAEDQ